jgi:LPS sulfotransferase NodH
MEINIGYQTRDYEFFDYDLYSVRDDSRKQSFVLRGPKPTNLNKNSYFTSIGAAFTYGCYTDKPYTQLVSEVLGIPGVNLGTQGAGPHHFTKPNHKLLIDIINNSKFVIISAFSGRSCPNSLFKLAPNGSNEKLSFVDKEEYMPAHKLYEWLLENKDENFIRSVIEETRSNYANELINLLSTIEVPKILLWFSKRNPDYQESYSKKVWDLLGKFPHLINSQVLDLIKPYCDEYVECVTAKGTPQPLFSRFTGELSSVQKNPDYGYSTSNYNLYYASPEMHIDAANMLVEPCLKYVGVSHISSKNLQSHRFIVIKELFEQLNEIHLKKLLLSVDDQTVVITDIEFKNYLFHNFPDHFNWECILSAADEPRLLRLSDNAEFYLDLTLNSRNTSFNSFDSINSNRKHLSFIYEIIPYLLSKPSPIKLKEIAGYLENVSMMPHTLYAVVCTPRSGSTFLCDLISQNIGGKAIEHLRDPLLYLLKHRETLNIDFSLFIEKLLVFCSVNGVFGTKLISHFLLDLVNFLEDDELSLIIDYFNMRGLKVVYLYREDKYAQTVSKYLASRSKKWHVISSNDISDYQNSVKEIDYDFNTLKKIYDNFIEEESKLESFLQSRSNFEVLKVSYECLVEDTARYVKLVTDFLGVKPKDLSLSTRYQVLSSNYSEELVLQFKKDCQLV